MTIMLDLTAILDRLDDLRMPKHKHIETTARMTQGFILVVWEGKDRFAFASRKTPIKMLQEAGVWPY